MKIAYRKQGDVLELGGLCQGPCGLWIKAKLPIPGILGKVLRVVKDGAEETIPIPAGYFRGCENVETCPYANGTAPDGFASGPKLVNDGDT